MIRKIILTVLLCSILSGCFKDKENCYQADVLERLQQNNLLLILSFEKEKIQRIKLLEA